MHELVDMNYGLPNDLDAHDEVMQQFFQRACDTLPISSPAGHMHLLAQKAYLNGGDRLVQTALLRLCDAITTVLYHTSLKCLAYFLDPNVEVFEWRCDGNCLVIRREGKEVIVGTFHKFGAYYVWTYFVRSKISDNSGWKEVYAGATQVTTQVSGEGIDFENSQEEEHVEDIHLTDDKFALYIGRLLGHFLLKRRVWDFRAWRRWIVVWEADGLVTNAREHAHESLRITRDSEE